MWTVLRFCSFKNSILHKRLMKNALNIPGEKPLTNSENPPLPHVLVGDECLGISSKLLRPFGGKNLTVNKKVFNYRLTRARRYIECTFGILANKWRIFHRPLIVSLLNCRMRLLKRVVYFTTL
jgi:hypothetical protein